MEFSFFVTSTLEPFLRKASPECGSIRECSNEGIDVPHGGDRSARGAGKSFHHFLPANHRSIKSDGLIFCDSVFFGSNSVRDPDTHPDPDLQIFWPPGSASWSVSHKYASGSGSFHYQAKIGRKTVILLFLTSLWLFTSIPDPHPEPDPYVLGHPGSVSQRFGSEDPDPYHTKLSRIPNTGFK